MFVLHTLPLVVFVVFGQTAVGLHTWVVVRIFVEARCSCSSPEMSSFACRLRLWFQRGVYIAAIRFSQGIWMTQNWVREPARTTGVRVFVLDGGL